MCALLQQTQVPQMRDQATDELLRIGPAIEGRLELPECAGHVTGGEVIGQREDLLTLDCAKQLQNVADDDPAITIGGELVEQAQGVAVAAVCGARDQVERLRRGVDALLGADPIEDLGEVRNARLAQGEVLEARTNGGQDVPRVRRAQDDHQMRRRLLQRLQQGAGGALLDLVSLVHDRHAKAGGHRRVAHRLEPLAHLVDAAGARCRVHLDHVKPVVMADAQAGIALHARRGRRNRAVEAVEAPREDARRRGLAGPARPAEQVAQRGTARTQGVAQGTRDMLLPDQVVETQGAVAVVQAAALGGGGVAHVFQTIEKRNGAPGERFGEAPPLRLDGSA